MARISWVTPSLIVTSLGVGLLLGSMPKVQSAAPQTVVRYTAERFFQGQRTAYRLKSIGVNLGQIRAKYPLGAKSWDQNCAKCHQLNLSPTPAIGGLKVGQPCPAPESAQGAKPAAWLEKPTKQNFSQRIGRYSVDGLYLWLQGARKGKSHSFLKYFRSTKSAVSYDPIKGVRSIPAPAGKVSGPYFATDWVRPSSSGMAFWWRARKGETLLAGPPGPYGGNKLRVLGQQRQYGMPKFITLWVPTDEAVELVSFLKAATPGSPMLYQWLKERDMSMATPPKFRVEKNGKALFEKLCASCHGKEGRGNGPLAPFLTAAPRDLALGVFSYTTQSMGEFPKQEDIAKTIAGGIPLTMMPRWKDYLNPQQIWSLSGYVLDLARVTKRERLSPSSPIPIEAKPANWSNLKGQGRSVFMSSAECFRCHGNSGDGLGVDARTLVDDHDVPILPRKLTGGVFKSGGRPEDIYRVITRGMDNTPMPSFDTLNNRNKWALVAYILSLSNSPK